ncbi:MAG: DUF2155 domain-containing protein [Alphaproteobacteria bacterium]|nr:DUF2155 domain-containing protein [Alphaproteobacteria bacterium]
MTPRPIRTTLCTAAVGGLLVASPLDAQVVNGGTSDDGAGYAPDIEHQVAILQGLDKITARISPIYATLGLPTYFGSLEIVVRTCRETPPTEPPESAVFMEIRELPPNADRERDPEVLFSGWMFASSPAVSALEHAVYDIWVVDCEEPTDPDLSGQGVLETITPASE